MKQFRIDTFIGVQIFPLVADSDYEATAYLSVILINVATVLT